MLPFLMVFRTACLIAVVNRGRKACPKSASWQQPTKQIGKKYISVFEKQLESFRIGR